MRAQHKETAMVMFIKVDGERRELRGSWDDVLDQARELRANGHIVEQVKQPARARRDGPAGYPVASSWIKR